MTLLKQIQLPNGRNTTNLGFGCAGILRVYAPRQREYLLKTAFEEGITHFDVARMYGMGTAEGILGSSLKQAREQLTIATKFGLPYETPTGLSFKMHSLARSILNRNPSLKKAVKKLTSKTVPSASQAMSRNNYSAQEMEQSLETSLQQLQTDRVDMLFIHEPSRNDFIPEDMAETLHRMKARGQIGAFGVACDRSELEHFLKARPDLCRDAIQYNYSVFKEGAEALLLTRAFTGIFGILSGAYPPLAKYLSENADFRKTWSGRLGLDLNNRDEVGAVILAIALSLNSQGVVLFFTSKPKRLRSMVRRLKDNLLSHEDLMAFRDAVSQRIHAN